MMLSLLSLATLISANFGLVLGDPLYRYNRHVLLASTRQHGRSPWQQQSEHRMQETPYMSWEEVTRDQRSRVYKIDVKSRGRPNEYSITSRLIAGTVAVFLLQAWKPSITQAGVKLSEKILRGEQLYRLVTPVFLHGGILHLVLNMSSLRNTGNQVEKLFGPGRYVGTYLAAGVAGNLLSAIQSPNPALGASGAVFGVFGAFYTYLMRNEWLLGEAGRDMSTSITSTMLMNLLYGAMSPQIDNWGHLGGLVGGAAVAYVTGPRLYLCNDPPSGNTIMIDRPLYRGPRVLETIGSKCENTWDRVSRLVARGVPGMGGGNRPWQQSPKSKRYVPKRSVKPARSSARDTD